MAWRSPRPGRAGVREFRPTSLFQHPEPRKIGKSAREWNHGNVPRLLASRPVLVPPVAVEYIEPLVIHGRDKAGNKTRKRATFVRRVLRPAVYGQPTFRNVIDPETGAHL